ISLSARVDVSRPLNLHQRCIDHGSDAIVRTLTTSLAPAHRTLAIVVVMTTWLCLGGRVGAVGTDASSQSAVVASSDAARDLRVDKDALARTCSDRQS